jgi:hypothetical protein
MRTSFFAILATVPLLFCTSCIPSPEYRVTGTVKDVMDSVVDPNADYVWKAVETRATAAGIEEIAPKTNDDWAEMRRHTVALREASDLLQIPGRLVAAPGEKSENPQVELSPEVIKTLIDSDRAKWIQYCHGLHDAATAMMKAVEARDIDGISNAGETIDTACENCHKQYWYPDEGKKK